MRKTVALLAASAWLVGSLLGCSRSPENATPTAKTGKVEQKGEAGNPGGNKDEGAEKQQAAATGEGKAGSAATSKDSTAEPGSTALSAAAPLASIDQAQQKIDLQKMPNNVTILTVSGSPVTVGDYRRMYKMQQLQLQSAALVNPSALQGILDEAGKRSISLSAAEKERLLAAARQNKAPDSTEFKEYLKQKGVTLQQFNDEVLKVGLAIRTIDVVLQQSLLNDLVNRELLCQAARRAHLEGQAMKRYREIKQGPSYQQLQGATGLSDNQLKDELVQAELAKLMTEQIQKSVQASDAEVVAYYNKHKQQFQHKERIRLSEILIAAPSIDTAAVQSVKTQVLKAKPKLSGKELDDEVTKNMVHQRIVAEDLLTRVKAGSNFAELANEFTDLLEAKKNKTGGDIGFQERSQLVKEFADAVWPLKAGEVYPGLVQTPLGYCIVKVTGREAAGIRPLSELKDLIRQGLRQQKAQQVLAEWVRNKRLTAEIALSPQFAGLVTRQQTSGQTSSLNGLPH